MTQSAADPVSAYPSGEIDPVDAAPSLGDALRQAREISGRSLSQLSTETRVHPRFLVALEQNDWSTLPSRVFAAGYVRAYAGALRLDETAAVERFKRDSPDTSTPLKAPIGIAFEDVRRQSPRVIAAVAVLAVAVIVLAVRHRGLAERDFERRFQLADYVIVTDANLSNGLLSIALKRELPEALKPRRIEIGTGSALIEGEAKAA